MLDVGVHNNLFKYSLTSLKSNLEYKIILTRLTHPRGIKSMKLVSL